MNYLITGGTGFIGTSFIKSLDMEKDSVIILSRKNKPLINNCKIVTNLSDIDDDTIIHTIINLAGSPIDCRWSKSAKKKLIDSRINTTKSLIKLINRLTIKPKLMISASAIGYYGNHNHQNLDETSKPRDSFTHSLCDLWEKKAEKVEAYGIRLCITRFGLVLGKQGGFIKKMALPFKLGLGVIFGNGQQLVSWIHIEDIIAGLKHLIQNKACQGAYNFVAPEITNNTKLAIGIGKAIKRPVFIRVPKVLTRLIFGEMGEQLLLEGNKISSRKLIDSGYSFKFTSLEKSLADLFSM